MASSTATPPPPPTPSGDPTPTSSSDPIDEKLHSLSLSSDSDSDSDSGPALSLSLEEDSIRKDHLFSYPFSRTKSPTPQPTKPYHPSEQQLLQEGKLGESEFSARLKRVTFGRFTIAAPHGPVVPACLILIKVDFVPKNRGWFRFRDATVEVSFEEGLGRDKDKHPSPAAAAAASDHPTAASSDSDSSSSRSSSAAAPSSSSEDSEEEAEYHGPLILALHPTLIRGHPQTTSERYNLTLSLSPPVPAVGPALSANFSGNAWTREGLHLVQGRLMGEPETRVRWKLHENEVVKGGVYEQPVLAVIVRHPDPRAAAAGPAAAAAGAFTMTVAVKATTYGGLAVRGKGGARITFRPGKLGFPPNTNSAASASASASTSSPPTAMKGLTGGEISVGGRTWGAARGPATEDEDLAAVDLEALTGMQAALLGPQGPGVKGVGGEEGGAG